MPKTKIEEIT